jgi:hypothetical protein
MGMAALCNYMLDFYGPLRFNGDIRADKLCLIPSGAPSSGMRPPIRIAVGWPLKAAHQDLPGDTMPPMPERSSSSY